MTKMNDSRYDEKQRRFMGLVNAFIGNAVNTHLIYDEASNDDNIDLYLVSDEWSSRGASGGSCWDTGEDDGATRPQPTSCKKWDEGACDYYNERPDHIDNFIIPVFLGFFPSHFRKMSFSDRWVFARDWVRKNCDTQSRSDHEYYGNWSQHDRACIELNKLYDLFMSYVESGKFGDCPWFPKQHGRLFVIAGLPASGKTELAKCIADGANIFDDPKERPDIDFIMNKIINDHENIAVADPNFSTESRLNSCIEYYSKALQDLGYNPNDYIVKVYFEHDLEQCSQNAIYRNNSMTVHSSQSEDYAFKVVHSAIRLMAHDAKRHFPCYAQLKENEFMFFVWGLGASATKLRNLYSSGIESFKTQDLEIDDEDVLPCVANIVVFFKKKVNGTSASYHNNYCDKFYAEKQWK